MYQTPFPFIISTQHIRVLTSGYRVTLTPFFVKQKTKKIKEKIDNW